MKILFIGDIVGRRARQITKDKIIEIKTTFHPDFIIANVENASNGVGITEKAYLELVEAGIDGMTSGNHIWDKKDIIPFLDDSSCIITRPLNYPPQTPGRGFNIIENNGQKLLYVSLMGRVFMGPKLDDPFRAIDQLLIENKDIKHILADFHAEATSEKALIGHYLDGRVSVVVGTHTHIQTADSRIQPKGTGFISEVGMVGALNSSLGVNYSDVLMRETTQLPTTLSVAKESPYVFSAVAIELDDTTGLCTSIKPIYELVEFIETELS